MQVSPPSEAWLGATCKRHPPSHENSCTEVPQAFPHSYRHWLALALPLYPLCSCDESVFPEPSPPPQLSPLCIFFFFSHFGVSLTHHPLLCIQLLEATGLQPFSHKPDWLMFLPVLLKGGDLTHTHTHPGKPLSSQQPVIKTFSPPEESRLHFSCRNSHIFSCVHFCQLTKASKGGQRPPSAGH